MTTQQTAFKTIYADPAWPYGDALTMSATKRGAVTNYPTMSIDEICALAPQVSFRYKTPLTIAGHPIADVAFCNLWVTKDVLLDGSGVRVLNAWGFRPVQIVPWVKGRIETSMAADYDLGDEDRPPRLTTTGRMVIQKGMGRIFRNCVEYLLVGVRGDGYTKEIAYKGENGLIFEEEGAEAVWLEPRGAHSAKPAAAYEKIERVMPGPYLELFARNTRPGWTSWGNQIDGTVVEGGKRAFTMVRGFDGAGYMPVAGLDGVQALHFHPRAADCTFDVHAPFVHRPGVHPEPDIEWP